MCLMIECVFSTNLGDYTVADPGFPVGGGGGMHSLGGTWTFDVGTFW